MYKNKYIDKDKKLFVMPKNYYLTKKILDENNKTEWDNYDYILIPCDSDRIEDEWNKNKKGELQILRGTGGCHASCVHEHVCPSEYGTCKYYSGHGRCECAEHKGPTPLFPTQRIGPPDNCLRLDASYQDIGAGPGHQNCAKFVADGGCTGTPDQVTMAKKGCALACGYCKLPDRSTKVGLGGTGAGQDRIVPVVDASYQSSKKWSSLSFVDKTCAEFPFYTDKDFPFTEQGVSVPSLGKSVSCAAAKNLNLCKDPTLWYTMLKYCPVTCEWCSAYSAGPRGEWVNKPQACCPWKDGELSCKCSCEGTPVKTDCYQNGLKGICSKCDKSKVVDTGICDCFPASP